MKHRSLNCNMRTNHSLNNSRKSRNPKRSWSRVSRNYLKASRRSRLPKTNRRPKMPNLLINSNRRRRNSLPETKPSPNSKINWEKTKIRREKMSRNSNSNSIKPTSNSSTNRSRATKELTPSKVKTKNWKLKFKNSKRNSWMPKKDCSLETTKSKT